MQVVVRDAVASVARGDVARLLDRDLRVGSSGRENGSAHALDRDGMSPLSHDEDGVAIGRGTDLDVAEVAAHPRGDVGDGRAEPAVAGRAGVAVQEAVLSGRAVRL